MQITSPASTPPTVTVADSPGLELTEVPDLFRQTATMLDSIPDGRAMPPGVQDRAFFDIRAGADAIGHALVAGTWTPDAATALTSAQQIALEGVDQVLKISTSGVPDAPQLDAQQAAIALLGDAATQVDGAINAR